jgi:hypothetical protein
MLLSVTNGQGQGLKLLSIHMSGTYEGLLSGYPNQRVNQRILSGLKQRVEEIAKDHGIKAFVIEPKPISYEMDKGPTRGIKDERLPNVACWGIFESSPLKRGDFSWAVIGWCQDEAALPTPETFREVPWENIATDGEI